MGLLDKVKAGAEQAASTAQKGVQEVQTKRELSQAYADLGRATHQLHHNGEITHASLDAQVARIDELQARLGGEDAVA